MTDEQDFSVSSRLTVLAASCLALVFAGVQLGVMPIASLSVSRSLMGAEFTNTVGSTWVAWYTAAMMLGAAIGGIVLGAAGDWLGRTVALGLSVLVYSLAGGLGAAVHSQEELLLLRFVAGLGVGGAWPNAVALVAESWTGASRSIVAGVLGVGINLGILALSQYARWQPVTAETWRTLLLGSSVSVVVAVLCLTVAPESRIWLATKKKAFSAHPPQRGIIQLFAAEHRRNTLLGIALAAVPLVGAWAASKWMIPWADSVAGKEHPDYKATVQGFWATGAVLGSFTGAQVATWLGRRGSYLAITVAATVTTCALFSASRPLAVEFVWLVFAQGFVTTLYFGWLPLYLPQLFPTRIRAAGTGLTYNAGRFATAAGVLAAGGLLHLLGGDYARVGTITGLIYAVGVVAIWWSPTPIADDPIA